MGTRTLLLIACVAAWLPACDSDSSNASADPADARSQGGTGGRPDAGDGGPGGADGQGGDGGAGGAGGTPAGDAGPSADAAPPVDRDPPMVLFRAPLDGETVEGDVEIEIEAEDDRGVVAVFLTVEGVEVAELSAPPFTWTWPTAQLIAGPYRLGARAVDAAGNEASATVRVQLRGACNPDGDCPPQSVRIINPVGGAAVCGTLTIEATATDDHGISRFEFHLDDRPIGVSEEAPWRFVWNTEQYADGEHLLRAIAEDTQGQQAFATARVIIRNDVEGGCDNRCTIALIEPADMSYVNGQVDVRAQASDDVGVVKVDFYVDNGRVAEDETAPYAIEWNTDDFDEGAHTVKAICTDTGGQTTENQIQVTVDRTPPNVELVEPTAQEIFHDAVRVVARPRDNFGIARVELVLREDQGNEVARDAIDVAPWETVIDVSGLSAGHYEVEATATDAAGLTATSLTTSILVDRPPRVSILSPRDGARVDGPIEVLIDARDDVGLAGVALYVDDDHVGDFDFDESLYWEPEYEAGLRRLRVVATDFAGQQANAEVEVTVDHPLEVELQRCDDGCVPLDERDEVHGELPLRVSWRDDDGEVERVEFFIEGALVATDDDRPFEHRWNTVATGDGERVVRARATSSNGATVEVVRRVVVNNCDRDRDGFLAEGVCGGTDCDDQLRNINPEAVDNVGDNIDQNCDGLDGVDADGDGHASIESGGDDCDDNDAARRPGVADHAANGVDNNCDGVPGVDADGDGHASIASGGDDCDDADPGINPSAYDGLPRACVHKEPIQVTPGRSIRVDTREQGNDYAGSCGGLGPEVVLALTLERPEWVTFEVIDANFDTLMFLRSGCDDGASEITCDNNGGTGTNSLISEQLGAGTWFLFVDGHGGASGVAEVEVHIAVADAAVDDGRDAGAGDEGSGAARPRGDGIDQNCDGVDGIDGDRDGYASIASGGDDCDDTDPAVHPCAPDVGGDGVDQNCDGEDVDSCDDCDPCTLDHLEGDVCRHVPIGEGGLCDDGNACTVGERCVDGRCVEGVEVACGPVDPCMVGFCDPHRGCSAEPVPDGAPCNAGVCHLGNCCTPECASLECGDDGCDGSCGVCRLGFDCVRGRCRDPDAPQIDRAGRPFISYMLLPTNRKDAYNVSPDFATWEDDWRAQFLHSLAAFDLLDGQRDAVLSPEVLAPRLAFDALLLDPSRPFSTNGYFAQELVLLGRSPPVNAASGGRYLSENVIDFMLSTLIGAFPADTDWDCVRTNDRQFGNEFPYLAPPH